MKSGGGGDDDGSRWSSRGGVEEKVSIRNKEGSDFVCKLRTNKVTGLPCLKIFELAPLTNKFAAAGCYDSIEEQQQQYITLRV